MDFICNLSSQFGPVLNSLLAIFCNFCQFIDFHLKTNSVCGDKELIFQKATISICCLHTVARLALYNHISFSINGKLVQIFKDFH